MQLDFIALYQAIPFPVGSACTFNAIALWLIVKGFDEGPAKADSLNASTASPVAV